MRTRSVKSHGRTSGMQSSPRRRKSPRFTTTKRRETLFRLGQRRVILDRTLEHLNRLRLVALLLCDLAKMEEDLALADARPFEFLEEKCAERALGALEITEFQGEKAQVTETRHVTRIDLECGIELRERGSVVPRLLENHGHAMMNRAELFRALAAVGCDEAGKRTGRK